MLFVVNFHVVWCLVSGLIVSGSGSGRGSGTCNGNNVRKLSVVLHS